MVVREVVEIVQGMAAEELLELAKAALDTEVSPSVRRILCLSAALGFAATASPDPVEDVPQVL